MEQARARRLAIDIAIMLVIGVVLAMMGPFGTFDMSFALRLVYWVGLSLAGYALYNPICTALVGWGRSLALPELGAWIAAVLVATVPMTAVVWVLGSLPGKPPVPTLEQALVAYGSVLVIGGGITLLFNVIQREPDAAAAPAAAAATGAPHPPSDPAPRFLDRLPPHLGSALLALEMEDHYVRAHTALGSDLVLLRMRDAVAELDGLAGEQVHRSWWVARGAVADVEREGRKIRLVLDNGIVAPVSRANVAILKDRGWF